MRDAMGATPLTQTIRFFHYSTANQYLVDLLISEVHESWLDEDPQIGHQLILYRHKQYDALVLNAFGKISTLKNIDTTPRNIW